MKKRLRHNKARLRSKKGMSLVELLVAVTIIVLVFGGTVGAMANGYSSTMYNAQKTIDAAEGVSLNDVIFEGIENQYFTSEDECKKYFFGTGGTKNPNTDATNSIHAAAKTVDENVKYVPKDTFPSSDPTVVLQYTIVTDSHSNVTVTGLGTKEVKGVTIKTAVKTVEGIVTNTSFVPYGLDEE